MSNRTCIGSSPIGCIPHGCGQVMYMDSDTKFVLTLMGIVFLVIFAVAAWFSMIYSVPAGAVGVQDTFGVVSDEIMQPGLHIKAPWTAIHEFSIRTQKYSEDSDVISIGALSNEGLTIGMGIAVNYHIVPSKVPELYKTVGPGYQAIVMKQPIHSVPRDIISMYDAKTLYSASVTPDNPDRMKIENELYEGISAGMSERGIIVEQVFIRNIDLPQSLKDSITAKLQMEQEIARKQFEVQKEREEANRKVAEAQGIADSNRIISGSLTENYLKWYWLQNMQNNEATTYIQTGTDGFPIALTKAVDEV